MVVTFVSDAILDYFVHGNKIAAKLSLIIFTHGSFLKLREKINSTSSDKNDMTYLCENIRNPDNERVSN